MIRRESIFSALNDALARSRVVVLAGPRQSGKTTIACELLNEDYVNYFDLEEPSRSLGVSESTTRRYLDLLTDAFMIRQLQPYHANLKKRQVRSPKIYVRDSGLLHQ